MATGQLANLPYLPYTPDPLNGGIPRSASSRPCPRRASRKALTLALSNIKTVIGIYDASLGNKSQEISGKAIVAREKQGDTGTFVYVDKLARDSSHRHDLIDLIPHVYDTERMIRIMGEDGKVDLKWINKPVGLNETHPGHGRADRAGQGAERRDDRRL
jgi:hypothetical protein